MTPQVDRLEALLERVRRNAARPRSVAASPVAASPVAGSSVTETEAPQATAERAPRLVAVAPTSEEQLRDEPVQLSAAPAPEQRTRPQAPGFAPAEPAVVTTTSELAPAAPAPDEELIADEAFVEEGDLMELEAPEPLDDRALESEARERQPESVDAERLAAEPESAEEAPASSRRVAASMDEALAGAAERQETPKTIPPESGPEPLGDRGAQLELARSRAPQGPTPEQLGETIHLEEGPRAEFELDEPLSEPLGAGPAEESLLEAEIPSGSGAYHQDLAPPPDAREELERVRLGEVRAEVVQRPVISTNVVEFVQAQGRPAAETFGSWLDASLGLDG
jgi:hypothetical protein